MTKTTLSSSFQINRLRAAAGLIPIIEDGLFKKTISVERASVMANFCAWAHDQPSPEPEVKNLAKIISDGLERIEAAIAAGEHQAGPRGNGKNQIQVDKNRGVL